MVCLDFICDTSIILTLCTRRTAPSTLVRGHREGWVRIRISGQTDWKRLWMVVTSGPTQEASGGAPQPTSPDPPQHKRRISFSVGATIKPSHPRPSHSLLSTSLPSRRTGNNLSSFFEMSRKPLLSILNVRSSLTRVH
jgi:hypothetical protein